MKPKPIKTERITIYFTPKERKKLDADAKRAGISRSELIRRRNPSVFGVR